MQIGHFKPNPLLSNNMPFSDINLPFLDTESTFLGKRVTEPNLPLFSNTEAINMKVVSCLNNLLIRIIPYLQSLLVPSTIVSEMHQRV